MVFKVSDYQVFLGNITAAEYKFCGIFLDCKGKNEARHLMLILCLQTTHIKNQSLFDLSRQGQNLPQFLVVL